MKLKVKEFKPLSYDEAEELPYIKNANKNIRDNMSKHDIGQYDYFPIMTAPFREVYSSEKSLQDKVNDFIETHKVVSVIRVTENEWKIIYKYSLLDEKIDKLESKLRKSEFYRNAKLLKEYYEANNPFSFPIEELTEEDSKNLVLNYYRKVGLGEDIDRLMYLKEEQQKELEDYVNHLATITTN